VIGATAGHPALAAAIAKVAANIRARAYGADHLSVTGPGAVGAAATTALGGEAALKATGVMNADGSWVPGNHSALVPGSSSSNGTAASAGVFIMQYRTRQVRDAGGRLLINTKPPDYYKTMYPAGMTTHYKALWAARAIYK
jgi:hypothetical protein